MSLFTPDNFKNDWYGWVTNQWAHALLGQVAYFWAMLATFSNGEFGSRAVVWWSVAIAFIAWEVVTHHGEKWWDSVEDFIFVCIYGAGITATAFHEMQPGSPSFIGDAMAIVPILGLFAFHTTCGVLFRLERKAG